MLKRILIFLVMSSILLAACASSATEPAAEPTAEPTGELTAATDATSTAEPAAPTLPAVSPTPDAAQTTASAEANCTVISRQPTPGPTEQSLVPPVSESDWVHGPDEAAVTFIEYGDFQ